MGIDQFTIGRFGTSPELNRRVLVKSSGSVVVHVDSMIHSKRPKRLIKLGRPSKSSMKCENLSFPVTGANFNTWNFSGGYKCNPMSFG